MRTTSFLLVCVWAAVSLAGDESRALKQSDVVMMYQTDEQTYADYGATVLAWGGKPTPASRQAAKGVKLFSSVGMVTEFAQFHERFRDTYEQALCRDINGDPVKVPWLTDHKHEGIPYWWCCTAQPVFRQYVRERVIEAMRAGADGLHVDDHLGTSGGLWLGICFCDRCVAGFRGYLKTLPEDELARAGITSPDGYDFRQAVKEWMQAAPGNESRKPNGHPLWSKWTAYQCRAAASFMQELRELAASTAGHPVPVAANAGLLWPLQLSDYKCLDLFSAETDHAASARKWSARPLVAYRLADAMGRPYAATASGQDWAFIKEKNLPGLVRGWIAMSYAAGNCFMAPHHQWCYTTEKGTHWYDGPRDRFAPLYQFVRHNAQWFDGFESRAELGVVVPHRSFVKQTDHWLSLCDQLSAANLSYRLFLAGDDIIDHPLDGDQLKSMPLLLVTDQDDLLAADRQTLDRSVDRGRICTSLDEAVRRTKPPVSAAVDAKVWILARQKSGKIAIHLLNRDYDPDRDDARPVNNLKVRFDRDALGIAKTAQCVFLEAGRDPLPLPWDGDTVEVPQLGLWGLIAISP